MYVVIVNSSRTHLVPQLTIIGTTEYIVSLENFFIGVSLSYFIFLQMNNGRSLISVLNALLQHLKDGAFNR